MISTEGCITLFINYYSKILKQISDIHFQVSLFRDILVLAFWTNDIAYMERTTLLKYVQIWVNQQNYYPLGQIQICK